MAPVGVESASYPFSGKPDNEPKSAPDGTREVIRDPRLLEKVTEVECRRRSLGLGSGVEALTSNVVI